MESVQRNEIKCYEENWFNCLFFYGFQVASTPYRHACIIGIGSDFRLSFKILYLLNNAIEADFFES